MQLVNLCTEWVASLHRELFQGILKHNNLTGLYSKTKRTAKQTNKPQFFPVVLLLVITFV